MRENCTYGSARGAARKGGPYRDRKCRCRPELQIPTGHRNVVNVPKKELCESHPRSSGTRISATVTGTSVLMCDERT